LASYVLSQTRQTRYDRTMLMFRRMSLLWLLMIWQGGFMFYGLVVINVGLQVFGDPLQQAWVTQRVTNWLNLLGAVALTAWAWDIAASPTAAATRRWPWLIWLLLAASLAALALLHPLMDAHMDVDQSYFSDAPSFHEMHRWYLRVSTGQWLAAVGLSAWTLLSWRKTERADHGNLANSPSNGACQ